MNNFCISVINLRYNFGIAEIKKAAQNEDELAALWRDFHMSTIFHTLIKSTKQMGKKRLFDIHFLVLYPEFQKRNISETYYRGLVEHFPSDSCLGTVVSKALHINYRQQMLNFVLATARQGKQNCGEGCADHEGKSLSSIQEPQLAHWRQECV